ncbi:hypothetical protein JET18_10900 [Chryseobacterium sp. L7]|uniref:Uncharacterized protein n=1 Tax=Chryseobacterium endalhagicum TaxID=2797638 RepID=A0ABS1QGB8_9FLAO|nr:hypothetical protein [Chryseobacterium endalhagicum]MBL1221351.1 hypothetical protein [Chryseobacterium endalhagicum]
MRKFLLSLTLISALSVHAQSINSETVDFRVLKAPQTSINENSRTYNITVNSPYNLTKEDVIKQSKKEHQEAVANFSNTIAESQSNYQQSLKDYNEEIIKAKEKFALESAEFKKLSLLERLTLQEKGLKPQLQLPSKPVYSKPTPPVYRDPNLNDYFIVDNNVLASQIAIDGYKKGNPNVDVYVTMEKVNFQDNAGQTYANQPTKILVKENGTEKINTTLSQDFTFVSSQPSDNINKPAEEKKYLGNNIKAINTFLNDNYGYKTLNKQVKLEFVKNKGEFDDLEKAHIYVTTNLRKLQATSDQTNNNIAFANMKKGTDIWEQALKKVNYKDKKAPYNAKIGKYINFNLIRLNVALENKKEAEKYLNEMQEKLVDLDLSYNEKAELKQLENQIYK